ncbi:MAG TPA: hypothetical protein P5056_01455 [Candidatus Paceibacterota bacterium]|nr:hypothetical protein [Candidatus Paceibacterota bacterium]
MFYQVMIFCKNSEKALQEAINSWLKENHSIILGGPPTISFSCDRGEKIAIILYKTAD